MDIFTKEKNLKYKNMNIAKLLINKGANIFMVDKYGMNIFSGKRNILISIKTELMNYFYRSLIIR